MSPDQFRKRFDEGLERGRRQAEEEHRKRIDPLPKLVASIPQQASGLSEPARFQLAELLRNAADLCERGLES